jgi:hypothetical protein
LFPWRTINGEAASADYAAGAAQYRINAAVAHAVVKYVEATADREFPPKCGAEMLVETARLWDDLDLFSERQDGRFCTTAPPGPTASSSPREPAGPGRPAAQTTGQRERGKVMPVLDWSRSPISWTLAYRRASSTNDCR